VYNIILIGAHMRLCKVCNQEKPFDATQVKAKASGFMGKVCYDCFTITQRARAQGLNPKDPEDLALSEQLKAAKLVKAEAKQKQKQLRVYVAQAKLYAKQVLKDIEYNRMIRYWVNTETIKQVSPQYQDLVAEFQGALDTFNELTLQFPIEVVTPHKQYLERLLEQAQVKLTKQGPKSFDYIAKVPRGGLDY
jgi:hypothetical protein